MSVCPGSIVLLSGGLDSTVALVDATRYLPPPTLALTFLYGQRAEARELERSLAIALRVGVEHRILRIPMAHVGPSKTGCPIHDAREPGAVAGRNLVFIAYATQFCEAEGLSNVVLGAHKDDWYKSQCLCKLIQPFVLGFLTASHVRLPLLHMTKAKVIEHGRKLGAPIDLTWSCYEGGREPCGECLSCQKRDAAMAVA